MNALFDTVMNDFGLPLQWMNGLNLPLPTGQYDAIYWLIVAIIKLLGFSFSGGGYKWIFTIIYYT